MMGHCYASDQYFISAGHPVSCAREVIDFLHSPFPGFSSTISVAIANKLVKDQVVMFLLCTPDYNFFSCKSFAYDLFSNVDKTFKGACINTVASKAPTSH